MARRRPDPVLKKTRSLARAGRRREAADVLEHALKSSPDNAKYKDELSRYLMGKPFSFELTDYEELQDIISDFLTHPQRVASMRKNRLKKLRHRISYLEKSLQHMLSVADKKAIQQLNNTITRAQQRHRRPLGKVGGALVAASLVLAVLGCSAFFLYSKAANAACAMGALAKENFECNAARNLLKIYDTGLYRTLNRKVGEEADRLRQLIKATERRTREIDAILSDIESGKQSVVGQGVRRRALIERHLRELGKNAGKLQERWSELCRQEQKELNQQRLSLAEELMAPLPAWQKLSGEPGTDIALLKARLKILQQRVNIYDDAAEALKLPEKIIAATRKEIEESTALLKEVTAYSALLDLLPTTRSYEQYREQLQGYTPTIYQEPLALLAVCEHMPIVATVRGMMQEHGQDCSPGLLQAAKASLIDGKPTFSSDFPASKEQLHLLDEILTNSALRTRLYELSHMGTNQEAYTEELPEVRDKSIFFKRSTLDPGRDIKERKSVEWENPHAVVTRTLDPRSLHKALGLDKASGFSARANIPDMLTKLLQHQNQDVPALAKAYVFHHLIQINNGGNHAILSGLRYAPQMRQAVESFERLRKECKVTLDGDCWLRRSDAHTIAERKYASWFHKHRRIDFTSELKKNLGALLNVEPSFCGYVNQHGEPVLFEQVREGQLLWYLSKSVMVPSVQGEPLQQPDKLSPIFITK